jgi:hypothetical protein
MQLELKSLQADSEFTMSTCTGLFCATQGAPCAHEQRRFIESEGSSNEQLLTAELFDAHYIIPGGVPINNDNDSRILPPLVRKRKRLTALEQSHAANTGENGTQREPRAAEHVEAATATQEVDTQQRRRSGGPARPIQNIQSDVIVTDATVKCNCKVTKVDKHCQSSGCSCRKARRACIHRRHGHGDICQNTEDFDDNGDEDARAAADTPAATLTGRIDAMDVQLKAIMTFMQVQAAAARPFAQFARLEARPAARPAARRRGEAIANASNDGDSDPDVQVASQRPRNAQRRRLPWLD